MPTDLRIVTLLPSATEIVCALGFGDNLVGVSHECDYPQLALRLPACTSSKIDQNGTSREIDDAVKASLGGVTSIYDIDAALLATLNPTHIVTQDQCEVCAVSLDDVARVVASLPSCSAQIIALDPQSADEIGEDLIKVGSALGHADHAHKVAIKFRNDIVELSRRTAGLKRPRVACVEWTDPLMAAGNWVPELVQIAGGEDLFGVPGEHAPWLEFDALASANPDVIVFMPCGFGLERSAQEARELCQTDAWAALSVVQAGKVFATDGNSYFNRPGPRIFESAQILAEILHPDVFATTRKETGWCAVA